MTNINDLNINQKLEKEISPFGGTDTEIELLRSSTETAALLLKDKLIDLQIYCTFIGYPRSGHSLIGALIDAHENAIIAHELDTLRYLEHNFTDNQIFYLLIKNSTEFAAHERRWGSYSYSIPGQGEYSKLKVIGDKKGGRTSIAIKKNQYLLKNLIETIKLDHRFIHVIRNPFDNIARLAMKLNNDIDLATKQYFSMCETNNELIKTQDYKILNIYHEDFIENPQKHLKQICIFLDLETNNEYLDKCANIVYKTPHKTRYEISWTKKNIETVQEEQKKYEYLFKYSY